MVQFLAEKSFDQLCYYEMQFLIKDFAIKVGFLDIRILKVQTFNIINFYHLKEYKNLKALEDDRGNLIYEFVLWSPAIALGLFILYLFIFLIRFQNGWNERINLDEYTIDSVGITYPNSETFVNMC